ncbi:MAG TPA: hypothetical protein VHB21_00010 [Minicystis sp.]|nr:hypothetical protein [Minicystis sp.]
MNALHQTIGLAALALGLGAIAGCTVRSDVPFEANIQAPSVTVEAYGGFRPLSYNGYVVYYDANARPYFYDRGRVFYVPRTYTRYDELRAHYYRYRSVYPAWYSRYGARYRTYRGYDHDHADGDRDRGHDRRDHDRDDRGHDRDRR